MTSIRVTALRSQPFLPSPAVRSRPGADARVRSHQLFANLLTARAHARTVNNQILSLQNESADADQPGPEPHEPAVLRPAAAPAVESGGPAIGSAKRRTLHTTSSRSIGPSRRLMRRRRPISRPSR